MVKRHQAEGRTPCLFLFDGQAAGVSDPALSMFTENLLNAISAADPSGELVAELKGGLSILSDFAAQTSSVSSSLNRSSRHQTHDMALFRLLLWDMAEALSEGPGAPPSRTILDVLRRGREECLALSDISGQMRAEVERLLRSCPGYIGSCLLDPGNPVQRRAFYEGLSRFGLITSGSFVVEKSFEGEVDFEPRGARAFRPNGLRAVPFADEITADPLFKMAKSPLSERGALSVDRLKRKTRTTVEGRVFRALLEASWSDRRGHEYSFEQVENGRDILEAVLPDGKFTNYLFNREHPKGGSKAAFIIDELGFDPDDWRFLAAQLYDGLMLSEPRNLDIQKWVGGYGARFNSLVAVTSRAGKRGIIRAGWMLEPGKLPKLSTAVPDHEDVGLVSPPPPLVLPPRTGAADRWWSDLYAMANNSGREAAAAVLPTPMLLEEFGVIEEGEAGGAFVRILDAQLGFAPYLLQNELGVQHPQGGVVVYAKVASQSIERAQSYARAFARVLALNGVSSSVESYYS